MLRLNETLQAWGTPAFGSVLGRELARQAANLPLQQALARSSSVAATPISVVVLSSNQRDGVIRVCAGIFYEGEVGGCSCAEDPTPASPNTEYCEIRLDIEMSSAQAQVVLLD